MFVNKTRLPHVLRPVLYSCPKHYETEMAEIFEPAWHLVASVSQLQNDGDFLTLELLGRPVLVRNFGGEIHAFLNVCPHRHSLLTHEKQGCSPELKCQYHGWEFLKDGRTGKIPDAQSFRPMPGGPECLQKFPTEVRGPLVFVAMPGTTTRLSDHLGVLTEVCDEFPASRWYQADHWSYEFHANWKVVVENTVESYHVATVHPKTLAFGSEEEMEHVIHETSTVMKSPIAAPAVYHRVANWLLPQLQPNCSHQYRLNHGFPNLFLIRIDAMLQVMTVEPLSPETCRLSVYVFILRATQETLRTRLLTSLWGRLKAHVIRTVLAEDGGLYPDLQKGLKHSPFQGTISTREELVHAFQDYIRRKCRLPDVAENE